MRVAMIGQKGIPSRAGGIEIHAENIAKRLVRLGCEVDVYCRKGYCEQEYEKGYQGINIRYAPFINTKHLDAITHTFFSTIKALFSRCDIFHYHALGPSTLAFIPRIFGKKVVCTVHGLDWQRGKWGGFASKYLKFGEYATARFANATITVSKNLVQYYQNKYDILPIYIPNGIERPLIVAPDIILNKYNIGRDDYILFLARLVPEKGAHYLIQAFKALKTDKKLVIAGGSSHSDNYEQELRALAKDNKNIIFTGFISGKELEELYSNAYLYVLPSDIEGLPISLLEAMSYGNCCLTSDIPENTAVIEDKGYSFIKSNTEDLVSKLELLLQNDRMVRLSNDTAADFVINQYNWDNVTKQTMGVYESIMIKRKHG